MKLALFLRPKLIRMIMKKLLLILIIAVPGMFSACNKGDDDTNNKIEIPEGYSLVWSDEFDGTTVNPAYWQYETGDGTDYGLPAGWGNAEKQIYTNSSDNSSIENDGGVSVLAITAREDNPGAYTSARLTTRDLISLRFGRLEIKAKLPEGQGIWPAIWMLGNNNDTIAWPGCGEIDIVEVLGHEPSVLYTSLHYTNGTQGRGDIQNVYQLNTGSFSDGYHTFTLDWTPDSLTWGVDAQQVFQAKIEADMKEFLRSFYLIMNVAVGGNWPGDPDGTTVFPQTLYIDYVRLFSKDGLQVPSSPPLNIEEETIGQIIEPNIGDNAIREGFTDLGNLAVVAYGGGGEPAVLTSDIAIDGDLSLVFDFPGGNWGGAYIELEAAKNLGNYAYLKFSLNKPTSLVSAEIKLESPSGGAIVFLEDYTGVPEAEGFVEYTIPLADFTGLDLTQVTIPFAIWNPKGAYQNFVAATVLIDNVYFSD
jgi:beta-glucanase (GH16 family)